MPNRIEGHLAAKKNQRFAIVVSRWNSLITERLKDGAIGLKRAALVLQTDLMV